MALTDIINFGFNYQQLRISRSLEFYLVGDQASGDPGVQAYDAIGGGYYPDYTLYPLVIRPNITVKDPDEVLAPMNVSVRINKDLVNMRWTVIEEGQADKVISNPDTDYEVVTTGDNLGMLTVKRNVTYQRPLTFVFEASYIDPRNDEELPIKMTYLLECDLIVQQAELRLDIPSYLVFNPIEASERTVHAVVYSGNEAVPAAQCRFKWQLLDGDSWVDFAPTNPREDMKFGIPSHNTTSFDISMDCMGWDERFRCVAYVGIDSADVVGRVKLGKSLTSRTFRIKRELPQSAPRITGVTKSIPKSQGEINPQAVMNFRNYSGESDPVKRERMKKVVRVNWKTAQGTASTTPTFNTVAEGFNPTIKADKVSKTYGQLLKMEVEDRGPYAILTDGRGNILTDGSGKPLMARKPKTP